MSDETQASETIIVTAEKSNGGSGGVRFDFRRFVDQQNSQPSGWRPTTSQPPYGSDPATGSPGASASVNIQLENPANEARALKAAENVAKAVAEIRALLERLAPDTRISWFNGNDAMTAAEALAELNNTVFIINDVTDYRNGGLGAASRGENGSLNSVKLNFDAFDGSGGDYADPNYADNQGVVGMMLHELAHITKQGDQFYTLSRRNYRRVTEDPAFENYNFSDFWYNNEAYDYDFAKNFAAALSLDISQLWMQLEPEFRVPPRYPAEIAQDAGPNP